MSNKNKEKRSESFPTKNLSISLAINWLNDHFPAMPAKSVGQVNISFFERDRFMFKRPIHIMFAMACLAIFPAIGLAQSNEVEATVSRNDSRPKIGIMAFSTGYAVEVTSVFQYSPASRLGLETGDRILSINGYRTSNVRELRYALNDAAVYRNGHISVLIENVRHRWGWPGEPRYVRHSTWLNGY